MKLRAFYKMTRFRLARTGDLRLTALPGYHFDDYVSIGLDSSSSYEGEGREKTDLWGVGLVNS